MQIRVLGCHGADQLVGGTAGLVRQESCGFLIDGSVLLDAGTIGTRLTLAEQRRIRFVLLSHLHFDHIKSLPTLVDNLVQEFDEPVIVAATEPVLQGLKDHVFNDMVYPNFFKLPNQKRPILQAHILEPGKPVTLGHVEVIPIVVNHTVPTVGYVVKDRWAALLYSGDTYVTDEIWSLGRTIPELKAAFIESSFPNELADLAKQTKHLTPSLLAKEWMKLRNDQVPVYAYHLKPPFREQIATELRALQIPRLNILEEGQNLAL
jgi:glyoxylase-like metal-dependent hydrolase (beta-lactamase superfamily II)